MNRFQMFVSFAIVSALMGFTIAHSNAAAFEVTPTPQMNANSKPVFYPRRWLSETFRIAKKKFTIDSSVTGKCRKHFDTYKLHLRNQSTWAIRMMESSQWPRTGLLSGLMIHPGNREECLKSRGPRILGKYCVVTATYNFWSDSTYPKDHHQLEWPLENESAWSVVEMYKTNYNRLSRQKVSWGMCMPESCTTAQLEKSVSSTLSPLFAAQDFQVDVIVEPMNCRLQESSDSSIQPAYVNLLFLGLFLSATVFDVVTGRHKVQLGGNKEKRLAMRLWRCFSMVLNFQILSRSSRTNTHGLLHILKLYTHLNGIFYHRYMFSARLRNFIMDKFEMVFGSWSLELNYFSFVNVDVFFTMSGFLLFYSELARGTKARNGVNFLLRSVFSRWLRLVPVVLVDIYLMIRTPDTFDKDVWHDPEFLQHRRFCQKNWWTNALAVNNLINPFEPCVARTWSVTVDLQLLVIGLTLLLAFKKNKTLGIVMLICTLMYSFLATFFLVYTAKFDKPCTFLLPDENYFKAGSYFNFHVSLHAMIGPYLLGCTTALLTRALRETKWKFSPVQMIGYLLLSYVTVVGFQLYFDPLFSHVSQDKVIRNGVFLPLNRFLSVLPVATLICVYTVSGFGVLNKVIEWKFWSLLGNLSFSISLVYQNVTWIHLLSHRFKLVDFSTDNYYWLSIGDACFSVVFAFIFYMTVEGPLNGMSKILVPMDTKTD